MNIQPAIIKAVAVVIAMNIQLVNTIKFDPNNDAFTFFTSNIKALTKIE